MNYIKVKTTKKGIQKIIKTLPHDSKSITPAITDISKKYSDIKYNLMGDAGFIINKDNIWGFQFHPEKSQQAGQIILKKFFEF